MNRKEAADPIGLFASLVSCLFKRSTQEKEPDVPFTVQAVFLTVFPSKLRQFFSGEVEASGEPGSFRALYRASLGAENMKAASLASASGICSSLERGNKNEYIYKAYHDEYLRCCYLWIECWNVQARGFRR